MNAQLNTTTTTTNHHDLARAWARWNGQSGTTKQIERIMKMMSAETLRAVLSVRGVSVR